MKYLNVLIGSTVCLSLLTYCAVTKPAGILDPASPVPPTLAPAPVTALLQAHCAGCHHGTSPGGGLDLTRIVETPGGRLGFAHSLRGRQLSTYTTFATLYDRLTSTDPRRRMPPDSHLKGADLELLFLWVESALAALSPE